MCLGRTEKKKEESNYLESSVHSKFERLDSKDRVDLKEARSWRVSSAAAGARTSWRKVQAMEEGATSKGDRED